ncbi:2-oxoglutarate-dependent dioxygenase DAO-like isoform X3 [Actinidia eriantha]|uniref:2-oxoglutarate-dependent dioxygenase DAO-like isoform X3 n=1 Tax=Actinidia eriantha TaxID=165200 RepID=UPI0025867EA7|nr:2-oxoglutarate-dependent dioxygenase DAO-like isoform X3 [Actinidia eriantha]
MSSSVAVEAFCAQLDASLLTKVHELTMAITRNLAEGMGLAGFLFEQWPCQFRINKYNFAPETVGSFGVQMHTDSGFLTILQDDENVGGLEVMDNSEAFVAVEPLPGTLQVNLGDVANVCTIFTVFNSSVE